MKKTILVFASIIFPFLAHALDAVYGNISVSNMFAGSGGVTNRIDQVGMRPQTGALGTNSYYTASYALVQNALHQRIKIAPGTLSLGTNNDDFFLIYGGGGTATLNPSIHVVGDITADGTISGANTILWITNDVYATNAIIAEFATNWYGLADSNNYQGTFSGIVTDSISGMQIMGNQFTTNVAGTEVSGPVMITNINSSTSQAFAISNGQQRIISSKWAVNGPTIVISQNKEILTGTRGALISGGYNNQITNNNVADAAYCVIGGGSGNVIDGTFTTLHAANSTISGGSGNKAYFLDSTVSGGINNVAGTNGVTRNGGNPRHPTVSGGMNNIAEEDGTTVCGGEWNLAAGVGANIGGGGGNQSMGYCSVVAGGYTNFALSQGSAISGGGSNVVAATSFYSSIGGGFVNTIGAASYYSMIGSGIENLLTGQASFIGSGDNNTVAGDYSFIGTGWLNTNTGNYSVICGGYDNTVIGNYSTAGGKDARATNNNAFVWSDGTAVFGSTSANQVSMYAANGFRFLGGAITGNGSGLTNLQLANITGQNVLTNNRTDATVLKNSLSVSNALTITGITPGIDFPSNTFTLSQNGSSRIQVDSQITVHKKIIPNSDLNASDALLGDATHRFANTQTRLLTVATNSGALGSIVSPNVATTSAVFWFDGTNLCVTIMDGGGGKTTNKVSLSAYP